MRGAFGKPQGTVARVRIGQVIMSVRSSDRYRAAVIEALRRAKFKFPGRQKVSIWFQNIWRMNVFFSWLCALHCVNPHSCDMARLGKVLLKSAFLTDDSVCRFMLARNSVLLNTSETSTKNWKTMEDWHPMVVLFNIVPIMDLWANGKKCRPN